LRFCSRGLLVARLLILLIRLLVVALFLFFLRILVGRVGRRDQRNARNAFAEQLAFFAEPKAFDAVLLDRRHRHRQSP
jgi:hypothetical protein